MVEFTLQRDMRQVESKIRKLNFRKGNFQLFREFIIKGGKRPAWLNQDLLVRLKSKKKMHRQWKQGQVSWEEYTEAAGLCRNAVRKAKAQLELNLARNDKKNRTGFYRYLNQKRKVQDSISPQSVTQAGW